MQITWCQGDKKTTSRAHKGTQAARMFYDDKSIVKILESWPAGGSGFVQFSCGKIHKTLYVSKLKMYGFDLLSLLNFGGWSVAGSRRKSYKCDSFTVTFYADFVLDAAKRPQCFEQGVMGVYPMPPALRRAGLVFDLWLISVNLR
jgi:hypothetical protein